MITSFSFPSTTLVHLLLHSGYFRDTALKLLALCPTKLGFGASWSTFDSTQRHVVPLGDLALSLCAGGGSSLAVCQNSATYILGVIVEFAQRVVLVDFAFRPVHRSVDALKVLIQGSVGLANLLTNVGAASKPVHGVVQLTLSVESPPGLDHFGAIWQVVELRVVDAFDSALMPHGTRI